MSNNNSKTIILTNNAVEKTINQNHILIRFISSDIRIEFSSNFSL